MDGYTAYGASITKDGNKITFECPAPLGMILDPAIAAKAPIEMSASGYADLIAKIPAAADWMLADVVGSDHIHELSYSLVQDGLREALSAPEDIRNGDIKKVHQLSEGLIMSGFAMQAHQTSRPASGAEHQFSHLWDMEHLVYYGKLVSHGFKVGIGTLATTAFYELLLSTDLHTIDIDKCVASWKSWKETVDDINKIFNGEQKFVSRCIKETKGKYVDGEGLRMELERLVDAWDELKERIRQQIMPFEDVRKSLKAVGAPYTPELIGVSRAHFLASFRKLPYMRSRYSIIDLAFRCGLMEEWLDKLFGKDGIWEIE